MESYIEEVFANMIIFCAYVGVALLVYWCFKEFFGYSNKKDDN